jgi:hypothetical protein
MAVGERIRWGGRRRHVWLLEIDAAAGEREPPGGHAATPPGRSGLRGPGGRGRAFAGEVGARSRQQGSSGRGHRGRRGVEGKIRTNCFLCNQWQWWVIYPNSMNFGFGGVPPQLLHENHGVGACSTVFLEQIHGGAAGVGCVWLTSFGAELVFWIWSCVELSQTRPKSIRFLTPLSTDTRTL